MYLFCVYILFKSVHKKQGGFMKKIIFLFTIFIVILTFTFAMVGCDKTNGPNEQGKEIIDNMETGERLNPLTPAGGLSALWAKNGNSYCTMMEKGLGLATANEIQECAAAYEEELGIIIQNPTSAVISWGEPLFLECENITIPENKDFINDKLAELVDREDVLTIGKDFISTSYHNFTEVMLYGAENKGDYWQSNNTLIKCNDEEISFFTIPNAITSIGDKAFDYCCRLTGVLIPDSVTYIGSFAFAGCDFTYVDIPNSVTYIGDGAFRECALTSVNIPNSVTHIGVGAFRECSLTSVNVDSNNTAYKSIDEVLYTKDGKTLVLYPSSKTATSFSIPNSVTRIESSAFLYSNLTSVIIPDGVTHIGKCAFEFCYNLTSIVIPDSVTYIGDEAFAWCDLTSVDFPDSVTYIGYFAFGSCDNLTNVIIPYSVTHIGSSAFLYCYKLTVINCEASSKPDTWSQDWDIRDWRDTKFNVDWGYLG